MVRGDENLVPKSAQDASLFEDTHVTSPIGEEGSGRDHEDAQRPVGDGGVLDRFLYAGYAGARTGSSGKRGRSSGSHGRQPMNIPSQA